MRDPISASKQLMIVLDAYATGSTYSTLEIKWAVGISTISGIMHRVTQALFDAIVVEQIIFPESPTRKAQIISGFEIVSGGLPQCAGAIDGCFIPLKKPDGPFGLKFWCYTGIFAIILLAVVDHHGIFTNVQIGNPGSVGDAGTFNDSKLCEYPRDGVWLGQEFAKSIGGREILPYISGDMAFPIRPYSMKNFKDHVPRGSVQANYNLYHVQARRFAENAFGRLKMRFQILISSQINDDKFMSRTVAVCCALHNVCTNLHDDTETSWASADENLVANAIRDNIINAGSEVPSQANELRDGVQIREHLSQWLMAK